MLSKRALLSLGVRRLGRISHRASPNVIAGAMATIPFKLADIGEGIAEVELLKWFVKVITFNFLFAFCRVAV